MRFDHLDDPSPPRADAAAREEVARRAAALGTRRRRIGAAGIIVLVLLGAGTTAVGITSRHGNRSVRVVSHPPPTAAASPAPPTTTVAPGSSTTLTSLGPATVTCAALLPQPSPDGSGLASGTTRTATARDATLAATLTGKAATANGAPTLEDATLTVTNDDGTRFSLPVTTPTTRPGAIAVIPWNIGATSSGVGNASPPTEDARAGQPLCVGRSSSASGPTVFIGLNIGGAHCCEVIRVIDVATRTTRDIDLGNSTGTVAETDSGATIVTADDNFTYAFASYAASGAPLKTLEAEGTILVDTTRQHTKLIDADANQWMQAYNTHPDDGLGFLAAWAGDTCLLGHSAEVFATLDSLNRQGKLVGPAPWPTGTDYVAALRAFLTKNGYC